MDSETEHLLRTHLANRLERGDVVLLTGAGFSAAARSLSGRTVPSTPELARAIWAISFPDSPFEEGSSLQDLFEDALNRHPRQLTALLQRELAVDADTLPPWYEVAFGLPWFRIYTLNVDDIEVAAGRRFALPRRVVPISATSPVPDREAHGNPTTELEVVHLNGVADDGPSGVTFSVTQYGERLARDELWYARLAADLVSHPFVFIGTRLDEPPLWQHIEVRRLRGGRQLRELRPRSYLVTPHLALARRSLLAEFNVRWVEADAEEFFDFVRGELSASAAKGLQYLYEVAGTRGGGRQELREVAELADNPDETSEFLLGQEPIWADIQSGRAARREIDATIHETAMALLAGAQGGLVAITGTAGSGKSTALMRESLRLVAEGRRVAWVDRESEVSTRFIREQMGQDDAPTVLAIDDGETFGSELASLVREVAESPRQPLVLVAARAARVDAVLNPARLGAMPRAEIGMPPLGDSDIDGILAVLETENRLGVLRGLSAQDRRRAFREQAGRQLLVAMYQATSGHRFEEKVVDEFHDLEPGQKVAYALVVVASALSYSMTPDEVLLASGDPTNSTLNVLERLVTRHVLVPAGGGGRYRARHRMIASVLLDDLRRRGELQDVILGLALVAASKVSPGLPRSARAWRFLRQVINHDFLVRSVGVEAARNIYGSVEQSLHWDHHYWLQRGSLEVEIGNVHAAENFLGQARALEGGDPYVETAWAYLLFKKALSDPMGMQAQDLADEAHRTLELLTRDRGGRDSYPYHILGSQGLSWARRGIPAPEPRSQYLRGLVEILEDGVRRHPGVSELEVLLADVRKEYLLGAVDDQEEAAT